MIFMDHKIIIETERLLMSDAETMQHYPDPKNEISYAYAISGKEWENLFY